MGSARIDYRRRTTHILEEVMMSRDKPKGKRGFASMSPEKRSEIARKGGMSVPADKRSFYRDKLLAAKAGAKGGKADHVKNIGIGKSSGKNSGIESAKRSAAKRSRGEQIQSE